MATLTDEQRKRIDENKRRALAIRAAKIAAAATTPTMGVSTPKSITNFPPPPISSNTPKTNSLPVTVTNYSNSFKPDNGVLKPYQYNNYKSNPAWKNNAKNFGCNKSGASNSDGQTAVNPIKVNFTLRSKERFMVDFLFDDAIVAQLKTVSSKLYDPKISRWHFPLSCHDECKKAIKNCKTHKVDLTPLPSYILKTFQQQPKVSMDYKTIDISRIEPTLLSSLYPFQKEGVQFGISKNGRCIIADDMGLGKTIQALGIAHYYYNDWPLLVACPSSMRYQWEEEIRNNLPQIPLTKMFVQSKSKEQISNPLVLITSYDLMAKCEMELTQMRFGIIIIDESHSIKNLTTKRTKTALSLTSKAQRCILLSGTPALSRPYELYPQLKAIDSHFMPAKEYGLRYCDGKEGRWGWDYNGSSNMDELKILLEEKFMIRRLKSNVLTQLPSKVRQVVILDKDVVKAQTKTMNALKQKLSTEKLKDNEKRNTLLEYYAETAKIKIKAINEYICQILETGNKFLVFAHHKVVLDEISKLLEDKETYYIRIDGSVKSDERKSVCDQFQYEEKFRVALLSITAASTGLTLTAANLVIFAELFWNPGILSQAEDRVHRIGQEDSVLIQYLMASGTADDHLWPLIKTKLNILNQAGLTKETFACEHAPMNNDHRSIMDYFDEIEDVEEDLSQVVDIVEAQEQAKRIKLDGESLL